MPFYRFFFGGGFPYYRRLITETSWYLYSNLSTTGGPRPGNPGGPENTKQQVLVAFNQRTSEALRQKVGTLSVSLCTSSSSERACAKGNLTKGRMTIVVGKIPGALVTVLGLGQCSGKQKVCLDLQTTLSNENSPCNVGAILHCSVGILRPIHWMGSEHNPLDPPDSPS